MPLGWGPRRLGEGVGRTLITLYFLYLLNFWHFLKIFNCSEETFESLQLTMQKKITVWCLLYNVKRATKTSECFCCSLVTRETTAGQCQVQPLMRTAYGSPEPQWPRDRQRREEQWRGRCWRGPGAFHSWHSQSSRKSVKGQDSKIRGKCLRHYWKTKTKPTNRPSDALRENS